MRTKSYLPAMVCLLIGILANFWGLHTFGKSLLDPYTNALNQFPRGTQPSKSEFDASLAHFQKEATERKITGIASIFIGFGIVVLAALNARSEYDAGKNLRDMQTSKCPKCNADLDLRTLKMKSWRNLQCRSCGAPLKGDRVVGALGLLVGAGIVLIIGLPMLTGGHPIYGILICIFCPATGIWLLIEHNRYTIDRKEEEGG